MSRASLAVSCAILFAAAGVQAEPDSIRPIRIDAPAAERTVFGRAVAVLDFDGDGVDDIAVGDPQETPVGQTTRGIVRIYRRDGDGFVEFASTDLQNSQAQFGAALAVGDFDDDGRDDLLIGAPGYGDGGGAVYLLHHSAPTTISRALLVANNGATGGACGYSFAVGNFDFDSDEDFATGCPLATVDGVARAGRVQVFYGFDNATFSSGFLSQASAGIDGGPESDDGFGWSLATGNFDCDFSEDLAIGVPFETVDGGTEAGAVHVLFGDDEDGLTGTGSQLWHQGVAGVPGISGNDDHFGWSLAAAVIDPPDFPPGCSQLFIGLPDDAENPGGAVLALQSNGSGVNTTDARLLTIADFAPQPEAGPPSSGPGNGHRLGAAMFTRSLGRGGGTDLAIHAEGWTFFGNTDPGYVCIAYTGDDQLLGAGHRCIHARDVGSNDLFFGAALAAGRVDSGAARLVVGVPAESHVLVLRDTLFRHGFEENFN